MTLTCDVTKCDLRHPAVRPHGLGADVDVTAAGSDSHSGNWLGRQADHQAELLGQAIQDVASHPQVVCSLDPFTRPDLKLPLRMARE